MDKSKQDMLIEQLRYGVVDIEFTKLDGTNRVIRGTLNPELIPTEFISEDNSKKRKSSEVQPVFDLEKNGWRSFRWDSLLATSVEMVKK